MRLLILVLLLTNVGCGFSAQQQPDPAPSESPSPIPSVEPLSCTVVPVDNGAKITCPDGSTQTILNGSDGTNGENGTNGIDGTNGTNATPVTTIQFCPQYQNTYPSSFPEYGLCINNTLYAVYWNGSQAFMAEIVPGYYSSTSPQGCNFTVVSGCQIE